MTPASRLHADFIAAIRTAWDDKFQGRLASLAGSIYWDTEDGRARLVRPGELKRLRRLAAAIGYRGDIVAETWP